MSTECIRRAVDSVHYEQEKDHAPKESMSDKPRKEEGQTHLTARVSPKADVASSGQLHYYKVPITYVCASRPRTGT